MNKPILKSINTSDMLRVSLLLLVTTIGIRLISLNLYPLMDTTEARYGEMARIMLETGNWLTPMFDYDVPFWGKPPIFTWLSASGLKFFGDSEFAIRVPHLIVAIMTLAVTWYLAVKGELFKYAVNENPREYAWLSTAVLATTSIFIIIGGAVMTDTALMFSVSLAMASFWLNWHTKGKFWGYVFFIALAIGMLAKGPIALILVGISLSFWVCFQSRWRQLANCLPWAGGITLFFVLALPWYLLAERATPGFLNYFLVGEHFKRFVVSGWEGDLYGSAHNRARGTIWLYWVMATLPWFPLFAFQLYRYCKYHYKYSSKGAVNPERKEKSGIDLFLCFWILSPLLMFTFSGNILWSYVLPAIPAFALLFVRFQAYCPLAFKYYYFGLLSPFIVLLSVAVIALNPAGKVNQKPLIEAWQSQFEYQQSTIYYLGEIPFSARYYSKGRAKLSTEEINDILPSKENVFLVFATKLLPYDLAKYNCEKRFSLPERSLVYCKADKD
jgi:4-amino-4-deoxy-L-arabinose transferase-like glycosyltransferase